MVSTGRSLGLLLLVDNVWEDCQEWFADNIRANKKLHVQNCLNLDAKMEFACGLARILDACIFERKLGAGRGYQMKENTRRKFDDLKNEIEDEIEDGWPTRASSRRGGRWRRRICGLCVVDRNVFVQLVLCELVHD